MSLNQLLDIRTRRQERLHTELQIVQDKAAWCDQKWAQAKQAFEAFQQSKPLRQSQLFEALTSRSFSAQAYGEYQEALQELDAHEEQLGEKIRAAETDLNKAIVEYHKVRDKSLAITREVEKLTEILEVEGKKAQLIQQRKDELELEDFPSRMKSRF